MGREASFERKNPPRMFPLLASQSIDRKMSRPSAFLLAFLSFNIDEWEKDKRGIVPYALIFFSFLFFQIKSYISHFGYFIFICFILVIYLNFNLNDSLTCDLIALCDGYPLM